MIWAFLLPFGAGLALTFVSLEYIPGAQSRGRKTFVKCGFIVSAVLALGISFGFEAVFSPKPVFEESQPGQKVTITAATVTTSANASLRTDGKAVPLAAPQGALSSISERKGL